MAITLQPYDPAWPRTFESRRTELERALAPWLTASGVLHIGSTAVPGLAAKPIIDMMAGVRSLSAASAAIPVLLDLGWAHAAHRPEALWFFTSVTQRTQELAAGLHLTEEGSPLWQERVAFRDALRTSSAVRDEYQALKMRLAGEHDELRAYTADKRAFVARVLADAGITL